MSKPRLVLRGGSRQTDAVAHVPGLPSAVAVAGRPGAFQRRQRLPLETAGIDE